MAFADSSRIALSQLPFAVGGITVAILMSFSPPPDTNVKRGRGPFTLADRGGPPCPGPEIPGAVASLLRQQDEE